MLCSAGQAARPRAEFINSLLLVDRMQRTISLHLKKDSALLETIVLYNRIVNIHVAYALQHKTLSKNALHYSLYKELRVTYPSFPSALLQCARDHAVEMLKGNKMNPFTKKRLDSSIRFDGRSMKVFLQSPMQFCN